MGARIVSFRGYWGVDLTVETIEKFVEKIAQKEWKHIYLACDDRVIREVLCNLTAGLFFRSGVQVTYLKGDISWNHFLWFSEYKLKDDELFFYYKGSDNYFLEVTIYLAFFNFDLEISEKEKSLKSLLVKNNYLGNFQKAVPLWEEYEKHLFSKIDVESIASEEMDVFASLPLSTYKEEWKKLFLEIFNQVVFWEQNPYHDYPEEIHNIARNFFTKNDFSLGVVFNITGDDFWLLDTAYKYYNSSYLLWLLLAQELDNNSEERMKVYFPYESYLFRFFLKNGSNIKLVREVTNDSLFIFLKIVEGYSKDDKFFVKFHQKLENMLGESFLCDKIYLRRELRKNEIEGLRSLVGGLFQKDKGFWELKKSGEIYIAGKNKCLYIETFGEKGAAAKNKIMNYFKEKGVWK